VNLENVSTTENLTQKKSDLLEKMSLIALSRLAITGKLNDTTPIIVLQEIAEAHGMRYPTDQFTDETSIRHTIDYIHQYRVATVRPPYRYEQYRYIARFVNPKCDWTTESLIDAFTFLQRYMGETVDLPIGSWTSGPQTPQNRQSLNACLLYKLCRHYGIRTTRKSTLDEMALAIRLLTQPMTRLSDLVITQLPQLDKSTLVNLLLTATETNGNRTDLIETVTKSSDQDMILEPVSNDDLELSYHSLRDVINRWNRITPRNKAEAIVLAAVNYKIDVSASANPLMEYSFLQHPPYVPADPRLQARVRQRPDALRLDQVFNPQLPACLYLEEDLRTMAIREGYLPSELTTSNAYEMLGVAYASNTFYPGRQEGLLNNETPFTLDEVDDLDDNVIVCFGSRADGGMIAFRYNELAHRFRHSRNFSNPMARTYPFTGDVFETRAINKLKTMTSHPRPGESQEAAEERLSLARAIIETELFNDDNHRTSLMLHEAYHQLNPATQEQVRDAFNRLLNLAMFMRGWPGHGPLPIRETPSSNQTEIDLRVTQGISHFEDICRELGSMGRMIWELPLLQYRAGIFQASTEPTQGLTIGERVNIVKQGDTVNNTNSCIRLSSNWLAASVYRYLQVIGMTPPFEIDHLRNIS
jgi:hypothetical protein